MARKISVTILVTARVSFLQEPELLTLFTKLTQGPLVVAVQRLEL